MDSFQCFRIAMDKHIGVSEHNATYYVNVRGIDMEFDITEEFSTLIPVKGTSADASDLHEEFRKVLQRLNIWTYKLLGPLMDGAAKKSQ